jgi:NAD(P)-dependent dehydrogenase (short-subunit alcohol dehydrogenase family)
MADGIRAIVTGHSRGFGAGIAAALLERDIPVLGVSRSGSKDTSAKHRGRLREEAVDLSDADATARWLKGGALGDFVDGARTAMLVNNAGLLRPIGPLPQQDATDVWRAVSINVGAALALSAAFVHATERCDERRILHISSGAGRKAYAGWSVYCATKAALDHHARAVALDRTPRLRICSLAPGVIDTDMQAEIRATTADRFPEKDRFVAMKREGALRDPRRVGGMTVEFLLSASFGSEVISELPR